MKRVLSLCLAVLLMVGIFAPGASASSNFTDIRPNQWYTEAVRWASSEGIIRGTTSTTFSPTQNTSRAMLVTILHRVDNERVPGHGHNFTDVRAGQWYSNAVAWGVYSGIMGGVSNSRFNPSGNLTRQELAVTLRRAANANMSDIIGVGFGSTGNLSSFSDRGQIATWAVDAMEWAVYHDLIRGVSGNRLAPTEPVTRAQLATILHRFLVGEDTGNNQSNPQTWTVSFNLAGGTGNFPNQIVENGQRATRPTAIPIRTGFTFNGWNHSFDNVITGNVTVVAQWAENSQLELPQLPDRRLTQQERDEWIRAYSGLGGALVAEIEAIELISEIRVQHGLTPVQVDDTLMMAARFYAQTMAQWRTLGHNVGPYATDLNAAHGASANVARAFGGNLRWNGGNGSSGNMSTAVERWMNSPGHRAYILSPEHEFAGIGFHGGYGYLFLSNNPSN